MIAIIMMANVGDAMRTRSCSKGRKGRAGGMRRCASKGGMTYKSAGVDIDAGNELVRRIKAVCPDVGGFGGLFPFGDSYLVSGTDGVGTKLKLAFELNAHDTIGQDLVAMSVNDIITSGAKPLFFLDYFATGALDVSVAERVVVGIVRACEACDCALLGGETAEMPDFYNEGEYDLSGFAVGSVKKSDVIDGTRIQIGDKLLGIPSSGVHSNGFSLVRKVVEKAGVSLNDVLPGGDGISIGEALIAPTVLYPTVVLEAASTLPGGILGAAHITGGGFTENIPRVLPQGLGVSIARKSWSVLPIFEWLQESGQIAEEEMFKTFNMGIGMVLVVRPEAAEAVLAGDVCADAGITVIGEVVEGEGVMYQ